MNYLNRSFQAVFTAYSDSIILKEKISVKTEGAIPWRPDFSNPKGNENCSEKSAISRNRG